MAADHSRSASDRIDSWGKSLVVVLVAALEAVAQGRVVVEGVVGEEADALEEEPDRDRLDLDSP